MKKLPRKFKKIWGAVVLCLTVPTGFYIVLMTHYERFWKYMRPLATFYRHRIIPKTRVISVIGSLGKTTTTQVIRGVMLKKLRAESYGNFRSALAENILRCRPWDKHLVLETAIGDKGQMVEYRDMVYPDITVVTSIASDHYASFGTLETTRAEKVHMVEALRPEGVAILNGDDPNVRWMATHTKARVIYYGMDEGNEIRASDIQVDWLQGTRFKLHADGEEREICVALFGRHMVYSVLAAVAVGLVEGLSLDVVIEKLKQAKATPGRMEVFRIDNGAILIDDSYKGTMESFHEAFDTVAHIPAKRRILVFGNITHPPGKRGPIYRDLGRRAARSADVILFSGSNFKSLKPGVNTTDFDRSKLLYGSTRISPVIEWLKENLREGDVVLIKSSGSRRFERITLALMGKAVRCRIRDCRIGVLYCRLCPFINRSEKIFHNAFLNEDLEI